MKKIVFLSLICFLSTGILSAQNKWGGIVDVGVQIPMAVMGDIYNTGFGGSAGVTYDISPSFQLGVSAGYSRFSLNEDYIMNTFGLTTEGSVAIIPFMASAKYFLGHSEFKPYLAAGLGAQFITVEAGGADESTTESGWALGAGFFYKLGDKLNLDVAAKLNGSGQKFGSFDEDGTANESTGLWLAIVAGLQFGF